MATPLLHRSFDSSSIIAKHSHSKPAEAIPPLKISNSHRNPITHPPPLPLLKLACQNGNLREALDSFSRLFTYPNPYPFAPDEAYSCILELCAVQKSVFQGMQIHAHMITSNAVFDPVFLGTRLVYMYGKCGSLLNAEKLFYEMPQRTTFTWNAIIGAYATKRRPMAALELFREMRVSDAPLDSCTFPCILKACGGLMDLRCGAEIHALAVKLGYVSMVIVVNALLAMYAKCSDLESARRLFDRIVTGKEDIVSWNTIISAYSEMGQYGEALGLFWRMQKLNMGASTYTFVAVLHACEQTRSSKLGMEIHGSVVKSGHSLNLYVANSLIVMYSCCSRMEAAAMVFNKMAEKDSISWNSILSGLVQNGLYEKAFQFLHTMQGAGEKPDQVSLLSIGMAAGRLGNLSKGKEVHTYAIRAGLEANLNVANTLMDMYGKCCCIDYMNLVFDIMTNKDLISWTTIIAGNSQNNYHLWAIELFRRAQGLGIETDEMMIGSILLACGGLGIDSLVKEIHGHIVRRGLSDRMLKNSLVAVYGECKNVDYASRMFHSIQTKDVITWTSMITCFVHNGFASDALKHFRLMEGGVVPDTIALLSILSAAATLSTLWKGKEIHGFLIRKGFDLEGHLGNTLMDMYAHCGTVEYSKKVFDSIGNKSHVLWTCMINAYGMHGCGKAAVDTYKMMVDQGFMPDQVTFLTLFHACSHSGLIEEGRLFFETMKNEYHLEPWPEHHACIVDLLARSNHLDEAYKFMKTMQIMENAAAWCALLNACHVHSNEELGNLVATELLKVDPEYPGNYVLISNVFAATGRWKEVEEVRARMKEKGLKKNPGCSWIELGSEVHVFKARDRSHSESNEIYRKLAEITRVLEEEEGYVPQTKFVLQRVGEDDKVKLLYGHSERLAIAYGLLKARGGTPIRVTKNLRICADCHTFTKLVSKVLEREIVVRDASRFHHFKSGTCSCSDFW